MGGGGSNSEATILPWLRSYVWLYSVTIIEPLRLSIGRGLAVLAPVNIPGKTILMKMCLVPKENGVYFNVKKKMSTKKGLIFLFNYYSPGRINELGAKSLWPVYPCINTTKGYFFANCAFKIVFGCSMSNSIDWSWPLIKMKIYWNLN